MRTRLATWRKTVGDEGVTSAFRSGGAPSTYPTRPLEEWIRIETSWEDFILHGGKRPVIKRPPQFHGPWEVEH
jgi:hypothetical protein